MKISVEGILGSARRINQEREQGGEGLRKSGGQEKADSVSINNRINNRLDSIDREFQQIQSSLTKNQIIRVGLDQLMSEINSGGKNQAQVLNSVTFEGEQVLRNFVGEQVTPETIDSSMQKNAAMINSDIDSMKRLYVELENIVASNLVGEDKLQNIVNNMGGLFERVQSENIETISSLKPDSVMRLIR